MYRLVYRNFGAHQALLMQQTVDAGNARSGIRWWEVRNPGPSATLYQESTFAPADDLHRWMGSMAFDGAGNIALGYSVANTTTYPAIWYTGRLVTDTIGTLPQGEAVLRAGVGSQTGAAGRWGDYTHLSVDPRDDCTFWYTNEYIVSTGGVNWRTYVGAFRFPSCQARSLVTPTATSTPVATATPCAMNFSDVQPSDWFYEFVRCLYCKGAISGYDDGTFRPYNNTTRGQMTKIVILAFDYELYTPPTQTFSDVPPDHPFYIFVETAAHNNIVAGYDDGTFRPYANVTRGQLSKIVVVAAAWPNINPVTPTFNDVPRDHPFYTFIETAACHGIISGYADGSFRPYNDATRAQIAKIVCLAMRDETPCAGQPTSTPTALTSVTPTPEPTLCPGGQVVTGTITLNDPTMTGRTDWYLYETPSNCQQSRPCGGPVGATLRHYDAYTYTNSTNATQCIRVDLDGTGCLTGGVHSTAYLTVFNPAAVCQNYLGAAALPGPYGSYSFSAPPNSTYVVIVNEVSDNQGCAMYRLRVSPCAGLPTFTPAVTNTAVPTATRTTVPPTSTPTPGGPTATATTVCTGVTYTVATATGTMIPATNNIGNNCDDCTTDIALPFSVPVYGTPFTSARVGSNGTVQFVPNQTKPFYFEQCLPVDPSSGGTFDYTLFADYEDLMTMMTGTNTCPGCGIYTATVGTAPNRQFVIRWNTTYFRQNGENNFEVVLTEGSGTLSVIYGASANNGADASTGIQRDLTVYTPYSCYQPILTPGTRVNYIPSGCDQAYRRF